MEDIRQVEVENENVSNATECEHFLEIKDLKINYETSEGIVNAVNGVNLIVNKGEAVGLVGETGAGKTTTVLSILKLISEQSGRYKSGEVLFEGKDVLKMSNEELLKLRGNKVSMIFQDPMTALNPVMTVGDQISEVIRLHQNLEDDQVKAKAEKMLEMVGIPKARYNNYPHQFSGGMKQRVTIAIALACEPDLLIADEPTTALDVTIQAQVLDMMRNLRKEFGTSVILITHDLGVVKELCEKVAIMYAGEIIEFGTLDEVYRNPKHPYTKGLFGSIPKLTEEVNRLEPIFGLMPDPTDLPKGCKFHPRCPMACESCSHVQPAATSLGGTHQVTCLMYEEEYKNVEWTKKEQNTDSAIAQLEQVDIDNNEVLLDVKNLVKHFKVPAGTVHAVDDVTFSIKRGRTLGVVGESGCGKSTTGRTLLQLVEPTAGNVLFEHKKVFNVSKSKLRALRQEMQIIFQDPFSSLNPRMSVKELIAEPLKIFKKYKSKYSLEKRVRELMSLVGLSERYYNAYPHELDGGRRQRIGIARALALEPKFIVCDEPVSALDVSVQAQVLNLLQDLQEKLGLTYMFITHDLSVVKHLSDEIMVMYLGKVVEKAPANQLFANPLHPYTEALLSAIPVPDLDDKRQRIIIEGEITSPINPKPGCRFAARCRYATDECKVNVPLEEVAADHFVACHRIREIRSNFKFEEAVKTEE